MENKVKKKFDYHRGARSERWMENRMVEKSEG